MNHLQRALLQPLPSRPAHPVAVYLIDPSEFIRKGYRVLLGGSGVFSVVGESPVFEGIFGELECLRPHLCIVGVVPTPLDVVTQIRLCAPDTRVLLVRNHEWPVSIHRALQAGVQGFLEPGWPPEAMLRALARAVSERVLPRSVTNLLVEECLREVADQPRRLVLTPRERQIVHLLFRNYQVKGMTRRLRVQPKTIYNELSNLYRKLGVKGRQEALARLRSLNIIL